jgi:hypothetical protein
MALGFNTDFFATELEFLDMFICRNIIAVGHLQNWSEASQSIAAC